MFHIFADGLSGDWLAGWLVEWMGVGISQHCNGFTVLNVSSGGRDGSGGQGARGEYTTKGEGGGKA